MDVQRRTYGEISLSPTGKPDTALNEAICSWRPTPDRVEYFSPGFHLDLIQMTGPGGVRFAPRVRENYLVDAAVAGSLMLEAEENWTPLQACQSCRASLLFQVAPKFREHLDRNFTRRTDLLRTGGKQAQDDGILPPGLGNDEPGWSITELLKAGYEAAKRAGYDHVSEAMAVQHGLVAAATMSPLPLSGLTEEGALAVVKLAMFDLSGFDDQPTADELQMVQSRLWKALEPHLYTTAEEFDRRYFADFNSFVGQISKQKSDGGKLDRQRVRQCILELVWEAHLAVARYHGRFAVEFLAAVETPLSEHDTEVYKSIYCPHPRLGGLSLLMLRTRFETLKPAVMQVFDRPTSDEAWSVLLRTLQYYGEIAASKRGSDREYKALSSRPTFQPVPHVLSNHDFGETELDTTSASAPSFEVDDEWRGKYLPECACGTSQRPKIIEQSSGDIGGPISFTSECPACGEQTSRTLTASDIQDMRRKYRD